MSLKISDVSDEILFSGHITNLGIADFKIGATVVVGLVTSVASVTDEVLELDRIDVEFSSLLVVLQAARNMPAARTLMNFFIDTSCGMDKCKYKREIVAISHAHNMSESATKRGVITTPRPHQHVV